MAQEDPEALVHQEVQVALAAQGGLSRRLAFAHVLIPWVTP